MPLYKLQFQPGINREITNYANEGSWWDSDKVRFRAGYPEKIGGWQKASLSSFLGTCRAIHPWVALDSDEYIGMGTNLKYYIFDGSTYHDVTPIRTTTSAGDVTFAVGYSTLSASVSSTVTTIPLNSTSNFPTSGGYIKIGSEEIFYGSVSGSSLINCIRGSNGTIAASHSSGDGVGCASIKVSNTGHGAYSGDFVTISGAASLGGSMTASILNQEYEITSVLNLNSYVINARSVSSIQSITNGGQIVQTYVYSTASDTGTGGASSVGAYQINTGLDTNVSGSGWGAGVWSRGAWSSAADITVAGAQLRLWNHDNFGEDLLFNVFDGGIYYWQKNLSYPRAVALSSLSGSATAPTIAKQVLVSDNDRHVIAFGCDDEFSPGVQDPLLIRFSSQENLLDWQSLPTNTAGSLRIGSGSTFVTAVETKQQIVIFTDVSVHSMQYLGPPFTFGLNMLSDNVSIASPNAAMSVNDAVYWMGQGDFYYYNGVAQQLPCSVKDYVFSDINSSQLQKVVCGASINYGELWWFYPSADSTENNRYVVYNYQQQIWYFGSMERTAWNHKNVGIFPIATGTDGYSYLHEYGTDDGSTNPPSAIDAYIESAGQDLGEGDQFVSIWRMIPDITFLQSAINSQVTMTVKTTNFPGADFSQQKSKAVTKTVSLPVEQFTNQLYMRIRGRQFAFRIESDEVGTQWRLGVPRLDLRTDGKR